MLYLISKNKIPIGYTKLKSSAVKYIKSKIVGTKIRIIDNETKFISFTKIRIDVYTIILIDELE